MWGQITTNMPSLPTYLYERADQAAMQIYPNDEDARERYAARLRRAMEEQYTTGEWRTPPTMTPYQQRLSTAAWNNMGFRSRADMITQTPNYEDYVRNTLGYQAAYRSLDAGVPTYTPATPLLAGEAYMGPRPAPAG